MNTIQSIFSNAPTQMTQGVQGSPEITSSEAQKNFGTFLKEAIENTNVQQIESDKLTQKLVLGEQVDLHEVMIAAQKASITLNTTMEVRNKVVEAYQEIIRMPV